MSANEKETMSDRPTPLTDAAAGYVDENGDLRDDDRRHRWLVLADFARDLERKLAEAREALQLIAGKNSMLRSYTAEESASDAKQALARIDAKVAR